MEWPSERTRLLVLSSAEALAKLRSFMWIVVVVVVVVVAEAQDSGCGTEHADCCATRSLSNSDQKKAFLGTFIVPLFLVFLVGYIFQLLILPSHHEVNVLESKSAEAI